MNERLLGSARTTSGHLQVVGFTREKEGQNFGNVTPVQIRTRSFTPGVMKPCASRS